ncbi:hypothetical protein [Candidatus Binatus sp.]|uniref:hypothetical protein n=1 Tax=Candidatus Binatus sp. TaxID=2811406 RepID=UPI003CC6CB38
MDKPKGTEAAVGAEQVVRDLVDALKSLQKKPAPLSSSPPGESEQQKPPESRGGRSKATTLLVALPGVSDLDEPEPEQIPELETADNSQTPGFEVQSGEYGIVQGFCRSHGVLERFQLTPEELKALSNASLFGSWTCEQDVKFMLRQIREASKPAEPQAAVAPEQISAPFLLDAASSLERAENGSSGPSGNKSEEREVNDHPTEEQTDKSQGLGAERNGLYGEVASQPEPRKRRKRRTRTGTKVALGISIASLLLWVLTLGILYKLVDAYRRHVTTIATLNTIINKQREISQQTISEVQAQAAAAKQASQAVESQADSIKTQADGSKIDADAAKSQADVAALSARSARDMVVIAEAAHVNVDAIYCSPRGPLSLDTVLTLRYRNSGRTQADNFESSFAAGIPATTPIEESTGSASEVSAGSLSASTSIPGGTTGTVRDMLSRSLDGVPPEQAFQKIVAGQLKFGLWGTVTYTDVLMEKLQENFEYVWDRNFPNACLFTTVAHVQ